jgi:predicted component of type VI protein secretion system
VVIDSQVASREHCTIEWRQNDFLVRDHSTNGSYVSLTAKNVEVLVHNGNMALPEEGAIAIGEPRAHTQEIVEFSYALVT